MLIFVEEYRTLQYRIFQLRQQLHALREALELYDDQYLLVNHRRHQLEFILLEDPASQAPEELAAPRAAIYAALRVVKLAARHSLCESILSTFHSRSSLDFK